MITVTWGNDKEERVSKIERMLVLKDVRFTVGRDEFLTSMSESAFRNRGNSPSKLGIMEAAPRVGSYDVRPVEEFYINLGTKVSNPISFGEQDTLNQAAFNKDVNSVSVGLVHLSRNELIDIQNAIEEVLDA